MRKLNVFLVENPKVPLLTGTLVETDRKQFFFEYNESFLNSKFNISPFKLHFSKGLQENTDTYPKETFGVFNDSLPDGWGMLLMDRFFRKHNRKLRNISALDRLAYIGDRGMGALSYRPEEKIDFPQNNLIDLCKISENSMDVLKGKVEDVLPIMAKAGGSPGGACPKILVGYNGKKLISGEKDLPESYQHWLIKFKTENDFADAGKIEYVYAQMAKDAGLNISDFSLFYDEKNNAYFGTKRFDRLRDNKRVHVHTLSNLIHADFRIPSLDYEMLFRVCSKLTGSYEDIKMCFRLMVFNIFSHNRDDHSKNFAFLMDRNGNWSFAPAYDLIFSYGPGGEHTTTVAGEGQTPSEKDIYKLASVADISSIETKNIIDQVKTSVDRWNKLASELEVKSSEIKLIEKHINKK